LADRSASKLLRYQGGKITEHTFRDLPQLLPDGAQLHVQIVSQRADDMVAEARALRGEIGGNLFIKLPVTREGFAAIPRIVREGMQVTATGIHSSMQGFMAAKAGARYVAPYVNRMDNYGIDGVRVASEIHRTLRSYDLKADVLAASFKNSEQVLELVRQGVGAITAAPDVLAALCRVLVYDVLTLRAAQHSATDRSARTVKRFYDLLESGIARREREVRYYASRIGVTPKFLTDTIRRVTGKSATAIINSYALIPLKELLEQQELPMTQIAEEMNFHSLSYFSRYASKLLGMTPTRYRDSLHEAPPRPIELLDSFGPRS